MLDFTANIDNEASGGTKGATGVFGDLAGTSYAYIETEDGVVKVAQSVPVAGGGTETWAQTLASGNTSGGNDPTISSGDKLDFASSCVIDHIPAGNTKIGPNALANNISFANIGIGENALQNSTTSGGLIGIGFGAGTVVTNTEGHTFVGESCNAARNTSVNCTVFGGDAKAGSDSVSVGRFAGSNTFSGTRNVLVGHQAGDKIVNTAHNTILGYQANIGVAADGDTTAVGTLSVAGNQSVALGEGAQAPHDSCVVLGQNSITLANRQVMIGQGLTPPDAVVSRVCFDPNMASVGAVANLRIDTLTGCVGPIVSSAAYKKNIRDTAQESERIYDLNVRDFDMRKCLCLTKRQRNRCIEDEDEGRHYEPVMIHKKVMRINEETGKEEEVIKLVPETYTPTEHHVDCGAHVGLIAEEVEDILPRLVDHDQDGLPNSVDYQSLCLLMLKELQNHEKMIKILERKIKILEIDMPRL